MAYIEVDLAVEQRNEFLWELYCPEELAVHLPEVVQQVGDIYEMVEELGLKLMDYFVEVVDQGCFTTKGVREIGAKVRGSRQALMALAVEPHFRHEWLCGLTEAAALDRVIGD